MTSKRVGAMGSIFMVGALLGGCQGLADPQEIDGPNHRATSVMIAPYEPGPSLRNPLVWEPDDFDEPGGGGSSGGAPTDYSCPMTDPNCLKKLTSTERRRVEGAILKIAGPPAECNSARGTLQDVFNAFHIFKGDSNIADREDGIHDAQGGLYTPNDGSPPYYVVHIDQDFLDAATVQALAAVLTHEGFHLGGYSHSPTDSYPYTTHPFNLQDKCVGA